MKMFKKLFEHNITNCDDQFFCHLCMSTHSNFTNALNHINEKEHQMLKYDQTMTISENCIREECEEFTEDEAAIVALDMLMCIPCSKVYRSVKGVLNHVLSEMHINKLQNEHASFDFNTDNDEVQIATIQSNLRRKIRKIDLCKKEYALVPYIYTIKWQDKSIPLKVIRILYDYSNDDCETMIKNGVVAVDYYRIICLFCYHCYATPSDIQQHIKQAKHKFQIKKSDMKLISRRITDIEDVYDSSEAIVNEAELDLPEINYEGQDKSVKLPLPVSAETKEEQNTNNGENHKRDISLSSVKESHNCQEYEEYEVLDSNKIVSDDSGRLKCNICMCFLPSYDHVLPHIKGKQHTTAMKRENEEKETNNQNIDSKIVNENEELTVVEAECIYKETAITLPRETAQKIYELNLDANERETISKKDNQKLQKNGITCESNTFFCTFCNRSFISLQGALQHTTGKSHRNKQTAGEKTKFKVVIDNIVCNMRLLKNNEVEELIDNINDENNGVKDKNKNDVILEDRSYYCELCNAQTDIDNLFEHINTVTHKCSILSLNMGDDLVLYECSCCKSIIQGNGLLINHLSSKTHLNSLVSILRNIKTTKHTNFSFCNILIPQVEAMSMRFIRKHLIFFDTACVKLCDDIKNNIPYRCSLCRAKLYTDHNLIEHCKARMHTWKVKQLFLGEEHPDVNNDIMLISKQLDNISITNKKLPKVTTLGVDFVVPSDVYTDVVNHVDASPVLPQLSTKMKHKDKTLAERLNKVYYRKHLEIEEEMYTLNKQKLNNTESNLKLLMPHNERNLYCLACNVSVSKDLYLLYEHICLAPHVGNVSQIEENVDRKKLSNQYMRKTSEDLVKCYACGNSVLNHPTIIDMHINTRLHKKNYKKFSTFIDDTFNCILQDLNSLWFSIQRFSCILCNTGFKYKLEFIDHIIAKHHVIKDYVFDFCIPCATLWLGKMNSYTEHCSDIMHKYLMRSKDFLIEDLPECIKGLLTQVDETVDVLIQQTQVLSNDNIHQEVVQSLENSMKPYFPSVRAFLFGSRVTGLGFANSDIDIYLDCGDTYYKNKTECTKSYLLVIVQALRKQTDEWEVKEMLEETRTPIIKLIYKRTGVHCDISVTNGLSVENSKLIRSFIDAFSPCKQLILFIKKWFSLFNLPGRHGLISYALVWLVIFYLQSESHLPSVATLIKQRNNSHRICGWETGVAQPKTNNESVQSVSELLLNFFNFYANFDYQHCIISPLMGYPLAKKAFTELYTLPNEMKPYIEHLTKSEKPEYFRIDSSLCVQDPFDLSHNLTKAVNSITLKYFKQYCQQSASVLLSTMQ